jgi:hypothetical protein
MEINGERDRVGEVGQRQSKKDEIQEFHGMRKMGVEFKREVMGII